MGGKLGSVSATHLICMDFPGALVPARRARSSVRLGSASFTTFQRPYFSTGSASLTAAWAVSPGSGERLGALLRADFGGPTDRRFFSGAVLSTHEGDTASTMDQG